MASAVVYALPLAGAAAAAALGFLGSREMERLCVREPDKIVDQTFSIGLNKVAYVSQETVVVAHLFVPEDYQEGERRAAIVVAPPATSVKEQSAHKYAAQFCRLGYITLAFDPRGIGESDGVVECDANPYRCANDVSSAVSYLKSLKQVDPETVFNIGIGAGAVAAAYETFQDPRVKALGMMAPSVSGSEDARGTLFLVRWGYYVFGGITKLFHYAGVDWKVPVLPQNGDEDGLLQKLSLLRHEAVAQYYPKGKVGSHPRWKNGIAVASLPGIAGMHIHNYAPQFDNIPVYMATGEQAASLEAAMRFYKLLKGPKDCTLIQDCNHVDLYWKDECIQQAVRKTHEFFQKHKATRRNEATAAAAEATRETV